VKLTVDGREVEVRAGASVLDAVNRLAIPLPQLCKDPDRAALGACRTCLAHVEGPRGTPAACHLPARDGMVVSTTHPDVVRVRSMVLDLTRSMLTAGDGRDGFAQVGAATERHAPSRHPMKDSPHADDIRRLLCGLDDRKLSRSVLRLLPPSGRGRASAAGSRGRARGRRR